MESCSEWIRTTRKNSPQFNTLLTAIMTLIATGLQSGSCIFNLNLRNQAWAEGNTEFLIMLTTLCFYWAAVHGPLAALFLVGRYEKRTISQLYLTLAMVASILLIIVPDHIVAVAIARVLFGLAHGVAYFVVMIHGGEVSTKERRGFNISMVNVCLMIGVLTYGLISPMTNHNYTIDPNRLSGILALICTAMGAGFGQLLSVESPVYLIQQKRDDEAIRTMTKLRGEPNETLEIRKDYTEFKTMLQEDGETSRKIHRDGNYRPLILLSLCKTAAVLTFNMALNSVRLIILDELLSSTNHSMSGLVIMTIRVIFGCVFSLFIVRYSQKYPMALSTLTSGMILAIMGLLYLVLDHVNQYVAVIVMIIYEVVASCGLTAIPDLYSSEAFNTKKKAMSLVSVQAHEYSTHMSIIINTFSFDFKSGRYHGGVMMVCGVPLLLLAAVFYHWLPETTGMTIRESQAKFCGRGKNQPVAHDHSSTYTRKISQET
ncbi:facilitated trehalose transporter Tret1-like [Malaya genurostris]|uniref:facilitated trehalose transporter Tret1-like n=1 Tax=Malaya genurostris TaxID=325434 RepID=UPI0026F3DBD3|nr:facilitated trehalose transporter Tret1-like [Malaya genurostris]